MLSKVADLLDLSREVITLSPEAKVSDAQSLMLRHKFSQLPIVHNDTEHSYGLVTYEAIIRGLRDFGCSPQDLPISQIEERAIEVNRDKHLQELIDLLSVVGSVIVLDEERNLIGIVTHTDLSRFFRQKAEDLMNLEDIELNLRTLIHQAFQETKTKNQESLENVLGKITNHIPLSRKDVSKLFREYFGRKCIGE